MSTFRFKLISIGEDKSISFLCKKCCKDLEIKPTYDTYNRPKSTKVIEPGKCITCKGKGTLESDNMKYTCPECKGSCNCTQCEGNYNRDWQELPREVKDEWLEIWEKRINISEKSSYSVANSFYRNW